jgi:transcriptional regulator with XRE-family HTH domain
MALRLGVSRALISKWERDVTEPTATQALRWAEECGVDAVWLLGLAGSKTCFTGPYLAAVPGPDGAVPLTFDFDAVPPLLALAGPVAGR